ncbi:hypothetical protein [Absidia glauca]|uniref:Uncharacterized protein n=1 Tax=Absidia glauca TaxID=4829 RepID=A0A163KLY6_ABSGL|nr:hypothetical protein [Absidia glauca]
MPQQDERIRAQYTRPADQPTPTSDSWPRCPSKTDEYGLSIRGLPTNQHPLSTVGLDAPARRTNTGSVYAACRPTNTHFRQLAPIDSSRR